MSREEGRRSFVRGMMIGVPAFAGSAALLPAVQAAPAYSPFAGQSALADSRIDDVLRRVATLHNDIAGRLPTKADARQIAGELRRLIGYRRDAGRDGLVTGAFQQIIDVQGREALIGTTPNVSPMRAGLVYYGIDPAALTLGTPSSTDRLVVVETLARRGVEPFYEYAAEATAEWELLLSEEPVSCGLFQQMMNMFEAVAATMCLGALIFPPMGPECFAATVMLTALKLINLFLNC